MQRELHASAGVAGVQYSPDGRWYWDGWRWLPVSAPGPLWARPYGAPEARATAAVTLVGVAGAGAALLFVGEGFDLLGALVGQVAAIDTASVVFLIVGGFAYLAGLVGGAIAVPMWMHRAFRNLPALGAQRLSWSPGWAAGGWFIPLANFVIPFLVMRELSAHAGGQQERPWPLMPVWWGMWLGASALQVASNLAAGFNRAVSDALGMLNDAALVAAGGLAILLIQILTRRQRARYAELHRV